MRNSPSETETIETPSGNVIIKWYQEDYLDNPREQWDHLGVFVDWHKHGNYGERKPIDRELDALYRGGWPLLWRDPWCLYAVIIAYLIVAALCVLAFELDYRRENED